MPTPSGSLFGLLRSRIEALFGEFRTIGSEFELLSAAGLPAVSPRGESEIVAGRTLVVNAPLVGLRAATDGALPNWLHAPEPTCERHQFHYAGPRSHLPPGMAPRVIYVRDPAAAKTGGNTVSLSCHRRREPEGDSVDLIGSVVAERGADTSRLREEVEAGLSDLMPYTGAGWRRVTSPQPVWDREGLLHDPGPDHCWPSPASLQPNPRVALHVLERSHTAALGFEGDLLLGWRGGDAIASQLS
jgi:hypothetical protein